MNTCTRLEAGHNSSKICTCVKNAIQIRSADTDQPRTERKADIWAARVGTASCLPVVWFGCTGWLVEVGLPPPFSPAVVEPWSSPGAVGAAAARRIIYLSLHSQAHSCFCLSAIRAAMGTLIHYSPAQWAEVVEKEKPTCSESSVCSGLILIPGELLSVSFGIYGCLSASWWGTTLQGHAMKQYIYI